MKRIRIVGLCLVAAFAFSALVVASAFATPPAPEFGKCLKKAVAGGTGSSDAGCTKHVASGAKYEWIPGGANGVTYTTAIKPETSATLETTKKEKVVCKGETSTGKVLTAKTQETTPTFTECSTLTKKCSTPLAKEGEIKVSALEGELGVEKVYIKESKEESSKNKIASNLFRKGNRGGEIVEFECAGFVIKVKGTVLFPVTANKMLTTATVKFTQSSGKQKPEKFEGGPKETLESSFGGAPYIQSGQTITTIETNKEAAEINSTGAEASEEAPPPEGFSDPGCTKPVGITLEKEPAPEIGKCLKKAVAEGTAKYEWNNTAANGVTYTTAIKPETSATLETTKKEKVVCKGETSTGKIIDDKHQETTPTFTECSTLTKKCSTPLAKEGEIKVKALEGTVGIEKLYIKEGKEEQGKNKVAGNLFSKETKGGEIVEFECAGFVIKVKGTVLFPVTAGKMLTTATDKFTQSSGKQKPEKFLGGPKETLESSFGGAPYIQSGQTITTIQTNSQAIEVDPAV